MNNFKNVGVGKRGGWLVLGLVLSAILLMCHAATVLAAVGDPQVFTGTMTGATNLVTLTNTTRTATTSGIIWLPATGPDKVTPGVDLVLQNVIVAAGVSTSNVVTGFNVTSDPVGTASPIFTTTLPITATTALTSTTQAVGWTYVSRTNLIGVTGIRWDSTQTTAITNTTVGVRYSLVAAP